MRTHLVALIAFLLFASSQATAQVAPTEVATSAARMYLEHLRSGNYRMAAKLTDPAELRRTRMAFDSLLSADSSNYIAQRLFRIDSTSQLRRLPDDEFTAGLMTFSFGLTGFTRTVATTRGIDIVGAVSRSADTALVVYRWLYSPDAEPMRNYLVLGMVRCGALWCADRGGDFSGLIRLLKEPMVPIKQRPPNPAQD